MRTFLSRLRPWALVLGAGLVAAASWRLLTDSASSGTTEELISGATPQWVRYRALHELRTGPAGATVELAIDSARDAMTTAVPVTVRYGLPGPAVAERRPDKIAELEAGIFYVDVARISEIDFAMALSRLASARGIVFDFRDYPSLPPAFLGHLSRQPLKSGQAHVPSVTLPDRQSFTLIQVEEWEVPPATPFLSAIVAGRDELLEAAVLAVKN